MKKLLSFKNNQEELIVFLNEKKLVFAKRSKKNITFDLDKKEINLIEEVLSQVLPTKELIDLGNIKDNNKEFRHFFDKINGYHLFYNNDLSIIPIKDFYKLNKKYNNETLCSEDYDFDTDYIEEDFTDEEYETEEELRRYIKVNGILKKVIVSLSALFIALSLGITYKLNEDKIEKFKSDLFPKNYTFEDVVEVIENNPKIGDEEKKLFLSCPEYIESCLPYFSEIMYDNLKNMSINYVNNQCEYSSTVTGDHNIDTKEIRAFSSNSLTKENENVFTHEYLHAFHERNYSLGMPFYEFLNVVINNEYFGKEELESGEAYDEGYLWLYEVGYTMLELFEPDTLRNYHANPDYHILVDGLTSIIPDEEMAISFLNDLNEYQTLVKSNKKDDLTYQDIMKLSLKLKKTIGKYYEIKFNKSIDEDMNVLYFNDSLKATVKIMDYLNVDRTFLDLMYKSIKVKTFKHFFNDTYKDSLVLIVPTKFQESKINIAEGMNLESVLELYQDYDLSYQKTDTGYEITLYTPIYNESSIEISANELNNNLNNTNSISK